MTTEPQNTGNRQNKQMSPLTIVIACLVMLGCSLALALTDIAYNKLGEISSIIGWVGVVFFGFAFIVILKDFITGKLKK